MSGEPHRSELRSPHHYAEDRLNTALVISSDQGFRDRLLRTIHEYSVVVVPDDAAALKLLRMAAVDIVIRDARAEPHPSGYFVATVREVAPDAAIVAIGDMPEGGADAILAATFRPRDLSQMLAALESKQRLAREVRALRGQSASVPARRDPDTPAAQDSVAVGRVLRDFTRVFAAGFDLPRVLEMFLDAIGDLVRPTRSALLFPDGVGHMLTIVAHRGLPPAIANSLRLPAGQGLPAWLARQGRPARLEDLSDPEIARELSLLQGVLAVPLVGHGEFIGVLVVGPPIIGTTYGRGETETLFDLATHLATAINDIELHHRLAHQTEFNERILTHMASGLVTIGRDEKIGIMNRRAEEILDLPAAGAVNQDLRVLPSPLGDLLFDTLSTGRCVTRAEIQVALRNLTLEVSTYPVKGEDAAPLGAVILFEDVTAQKELNAQRRQTEQMQFLTRVVARIAEEIKNPLVSISAFMELLEERYDDRDFRKHFSSVVSGDVHRLTEVFETLSGLIGESEVQLAPVDARTVVDEVVRSLDASDARAGKRLQLAVHPELAAPMIRADAAQLRKALSYLIRYLAHNSPGDEATVSISVGPSSDAQSSVQIVVTSRTAVVPPERLQSIVDPLEIVQESLINVGPAVSQRLVEAQGGQVRTRQGRHEISFVVTLPALVS